MGNDLDNYRASIGCFNCTLSSHVKGDKNRNYEGFPTYLGIILLLYATYKNLYFLLFIALYILTISHNIHPNPGPTFNGRPLIKLCNFNARSIKVEQRFDLMKEKLTPTFDIITVTETWLKNIHKDSDYKIPNYNGPMRLDRPEGIAGGVMIWAKQTIISKRRKDLEQKGLELVWVEMMSDNKKFLVGTCYRQPAGDYTAKFWEYLQDSLNLARQTGIFNIILTGDFNADGRHNETAIKALKSFLDNNNLHQHVTKPTRIVDGSANKLDLIIT